MSGIIHQTSQWVSNKLPWGQHNQETPACNAMANSGYNPTMPPGMSMPYRPPGPGNFPPFSPSQGNPYQRSGAPPPQGFSPQQKAQAKGGPTLVQPLPRDVMEKRLPVKALPKRPKISLTPDQIRYNPNLVESMKFQEEFVAMPWDFSNHIDPFNNH